ncbi:MAG: hypothetical protein HY560_00810 [Gemmatimonadetes bacterium]|nr:hypothetical protein [Gemmatimonadota bacterium]
MTRLQRMAWSLTAAGAMMAAPLAEARAQRVTLVVGGMSARVHNFAGAPSEALSNRVLLGEGTVSLNRFFLEAGYLQGGLSAETGLSAPQDIVEGRLLAGAWPLRWLALKAGMHARSYVLSAGTRRWVFFEVRSRAERWLASDVLGIHVELWAAPAATFNIDEQLDQARGGETGLRLRLSPLPLWAGLAYRVDQARMSGGTRREMTEGLVLTVGFGSTGR